jgi:predicted lipid-binding transport protein (Tim44 family)
MKTLIAVVVALVSTSFVIEDAEARRMSGGRNLGMQRSAPPTPQKAAPAQQQQTAPSTPAQQPAGASKWLGPLAGLALGAGVAALFLNNGWAGLLAGLLLLGLIIAAVAFAARVFMRGRVAQAPLQYAGAGAGTQPAQGGYSSGAGAHSGAATTGRWPAGFNAADFLRHARLNFVRLQEAHNKRDLSALREFLAPEVYREIEADIRAAGPAVEDTEVLTLEADVLDVIEDARSYVVSVRFSGMIRESAGRDAEPFSETWHLEKPLDGSSGWVVAGIQQA